jgi:hypothetical protein
MSGVAETNRTVEPPVQATVMTPPVLANVAVGGDVAGVVRGDEVVVLAGWS